MCVVGVVRPCLPANLTCQGGRAFPCYPEPAGEESRAPSSLAASVSLLHRPPSRVISRLSRNPDLPYRRGTCSAAEAQGSLESRRPETPRSLDSARDDTRGWAVERRYASSKRRGRARPIPCSAGRDDMVGGRRLSHERGCGLCRSRWATRRSAPPRTTPGGGATTRANRVGGDEILRVSSDASRSACAEGLWGNEAGPRSFA